MRDLGKTTLVERLLAQVPDSAAVHTDDVAWHLAFLTGLLCPPDVRWYGWRGADHHAERCPTSSTLRSACSATTLKPDVDSGLGTGRKRKSCTGSGKKKFPSFLKTGHGSGLQ
jgi:hypothetical protein